MRKLLSLVIVAGLAACGGGGGDGGQGVLPPDSAECSNDGQKQFVLDNLYAWYLWNDLLPASINIADYATPEDLIREVTLEFGPQDSNGNPIDLFSSVGSAQADSQFFGEGRFEGFGFSWRLVGAGDARLSRVFSGSPAANGGLQRGQRILTLDGRSIADIEANEGINAVFANDTVVFEMLRPDNSSFTVSLTKDVVTIDPVPQYRIIDAGNGVNVGYMELSTFISTADPVFDTVFAAFRNATPPVNDVIIDLRYNGGGLVSTAELLGDYFGGDVAENLVFSSTEFNADRAAANNSTELFARLGNSLSLSRLVVIATRGTASASELVTNGMDPHVEVTIVGDRTFGKPVGQIGLQFCEKIMRPTSFRIANADGFGEYFDGLPADCAAADDLNVAVGADNDPNMVAAMSYLNTGACPVVAVPGGQFKTQGEKWAEPPLIDRSGRPEREFAGAY